MRLEDYDAAYRGPTLDELEDECAYYAQWQDEQRRNREASVDAPRCSWCGRLLTPGVVCPDHDEVMPS